MQSFRRGEYNIPANYRGNAFTADEPPIITDTPQSEPERARETRQSEEETTEQLRVGEQAPFALAEAEECGREEKHTERRDEKKESKEPKEGILRSILSHFERGFEFEDLLLLGLIFLLLQGGGKDDTKNRDEMILILAFLFLCGF